MLLKAICYLEIIKGWHLISCFLGIITAGMKMDHVHFKEFDAMNTPVKNSQWPRGFIMMFSKNSAAQRLQISWASINRIFAAHCPVATQKFLSSLKVLVGSSSDRFLNFIINPLKFPFFSLHSLLSKMPPIFSAILVPLALLCWQLFTKNIYCLVLSATSNHHRLWTFTPGHCIIVFFKSPWNYQALFWENQL